MDVIELAAVVAVIFALLSFANTLGMHLAVRAIRRRTDAFFDDPIGEVLVLMLNADVERKKQMELVLGWVGRSIVKGAKSELLGDPAVPGVEGKRPRGLLGKLLDFLPIVQAFFPGSKAAGAAAAAGTAAKVIENAGLAEMKRRGEG